MPTSVTFNLEENMGYWHKLFEMKLNYQQFLNNFIETEEENQNYCNAYHARIIRTLLESTPSTHNFPCRIELLTAIEARLTDWKEGDDIVE